MARFAFDPYSSANQKIVDALIAGASFLTAYLIRFDGSIPPSFQLQLWLLLPFVMLAHVLVNRILGTYRLVWKYVSLSDAITLALHYAVLPVMMLGVGWFAAGRWGALRLPLSILVFWYLVCLLGGLAARACRRLLYERTITEILTRTDATGLLLIGAGRAGVKAAEELRSRKEFCPVGFLDDDPAKQNLLIGGLPVLGTTHSLGRTIQEHGIRLAAVCIAKPPRELLRRIWATCELLAVPVKIIPQLDEILHGRTTIANFRDVEMSDLLGREVVPNPGNAVELHSTYSGKRILVTGGGGSIGSEVALQLSKLRPSKLIVLDKDENGLNDICVRLASKATGEVVPVVADLRFAERLRAIFETHRPEIVFHAAAHKHVHLMEVNPCEAVANNVTGTRNLVERSVASGVSRFVQISTDKAAAPTSVMGASKRVCEMIVQAEEDRGRTVFACVRFGNVLGSRGSVVPIFQEQILRGGPVTLTHPEAKRFLMTIPEAVTLVLQAGTLAHARREIFVLDMGEPVLIRKLAQDLIELSGLSPSHDVRIEVTGMKRGEKLSEVLLDKSREQLRPTGLDKIQTIAAQGFDLGDFAAKLRVLEKAAWDGDADEVYPALAALNMGFVYDEIKRPWPRSMPRPAAAARAASSLGL